MWSLKEINYVLKRGNELSLELSQNGYIADKVKEYLVSEGVKAQLSIWRKCVMCRRKTGWEAV